MKLHVSPPCRTRPLTSCCTPETSRATSRWWKGKSEADPFRREVGEEKAREDNLSVADKGQTEPARFPSTLGCAVVCCCGNAPDPGWPLLASLASLAIVMKGRDDFV